MTEPVREGEWVGIATTPKPTDWRCEGGQRENGEPLTQPESALVPMTDCVRGFHTVADGIECALCLHMRDVEALGKALASGALRTYDPQTQVAVPREELEVLRSEFGGMGWDKLAQAITRWLADGNEEGR